MRFPHVYANGVHGHVEQLGKLRYRKMHGSDFPKTSVSKIVQPIASTSLVSHHAPAHILPPWLPGLPQEGHPGT